MHKYLFMEIDGQNLIEKHIFKARMKGIRLIERKLNTTNNQVNEIIYHDERRHQQEFICDKGLRFLIYRI